MHSRASARRPTCRRPRIVFDQILDDTARLRNRRNIPLPVENIDHFRIPLFDERFIAHRNGDVRVGIADKRIPTDRIVVIRIVHFANLNKTKRVNNTIYRLHIPTDGQKRNNKIKEGNTTSIQERGIRNGCPALTEPAPPGSGRHLSSHSNSYPSRLPVCSLESSLRELNCSTVTSFDTL